MIFRPETRAAFTLIEMMISITVAALILGAAYATLESGFASQKLVEPRLDAVQNARVALAFLSADLRSACPLSKDYDFLGAQRQIDGAEADNLDFGTHNFTPRHPREGDFCQVSYYVEKNPRDSQLTLWRRRNPRFAENALSGGSREPIARGISSLQFEYYDGYDWYDTWGDPKKKSERATRESAIPQPNDSGMPMAVRITLAVNLGPSAKKMNEESNSEPPMVFRTVAPLELAQLFQDSGGGGSPAANSP